MSAIGDFLTNTEVQAELGRRLRLRRLERNFTIDAVAALAGTNRKTIIELENGRDVRLSTLVKYLRTLGMLGMLEAVVPDTLPGAEAFSRAGKVRQRATGRPRGERPAHSSTSS